MTRTDDANGEAEMTRDADYEAWADEFEKTLPDEDYARRMTEQAIDEMYAEQVYREKVEGVEPNPDCPW